MLLRVILRNMQLGYLIKFIGYGWSKEYTAHLKLKKKMYMRY